MSGDFIVLIQIDFVPVIRNMYFCMLLWNALIICFRHTLFASWQKRLTLFGHLWKITSRARSLYSLLRANR